MDAVEEIKQMGQEADDAVSVEERERLIKAKYITERIMGVAYARAREILRKKNGWICGTFNTSFRRNIERELLSSFDELEMNYIIEHLPPENEKDTCFGIVDIDNQLRAILCNDILNSLVPGLYIHHYHDYLL